MRTVSVEFTRNLRHECSRGYSRSRAQPALQIIKLAGYNQQVGSRTGRSLLGLSRVAGGGKSELRRAVCRITSGRLGSSPADGQCHRKYTAPLRQGKGEKVR